MQRWGARARGCKSPHPRQQPPQPPTRPPAHRAHPPVCPKSTSICVIARTRLLSTMSPVRSFCGTRRSRAGQDRRADEGKGQGPGSIKVLPVSCCCSADVLLPESLRRGQLARAVPSPAPAALQPALANTHTAHLHTVEQHVEQALADAAVAHHHVPPQVKPQLVHRRLVLQQAAGGAGGRAGRRGTRAVGSSVVGKPNRQIQHPEPPLALHSTAPA